MTTSKTDLSDLFNRYGSDKDRNGYSSLYYTLFHTLRSNPVTLLEVGIGTMIENVPSSMLNYGLSGYAPGGSLRAWRDFFHEGRIMGFDVQPDTQFENESRIETYLCDSTQQKDVSKCIIDIFGAEQNSGVYDIIIDDGLHTDTAQIKTLINLWPYLKADGIYVIEDIYPSSNVSKHPRILTEIVGDNVPIFFSGLQNNQCVIIKTVLNKKTTHF